MEQFSKAAAHIIDDVLAHDPIAATFAGVHTYDHDMPDLSADGFAQRQARARAYLDTLHGYDSAPLDVDDRLDRDLMLATIEVKLRELVEVQDFRRNPSLYCDAAVNGVYAILLRDYAPFDERLPALRSRLEQIPAVLRSGTQNLDRPPRIWIETALDECAGAKSFFTDAVGPLVDDRPDARRALHGALEALGAFETELQARLGRADGAAFALGRDLFDYKLAREHMLPYDADSLLEFGESAVRSTQAALESVAARIDASKSWPQLVEALREDHPSEESLLDEYRRSLAAARQFVVQQALVSIPQGERLNLVETPAFLRPTLPYAAYQPAGAFDAKQDGTYYVTPVQADAPAATRRDQLLGHNRYGMLLTNVHEGYPGHHLQLVRSNRVSSVPRRIFGDSSVFCEGWALYCEQMVLDAGIDPDPRVRLFQLKDQLWRACRVVVDVRLHTSGLSFEDAVDFMVDVAHLERFNAIGEVRRYTQTPTQPMSYLVGKQQIMDLRERERSRLGSSFDLRSFHDRLLSVGTVPIALVESRLAAT